MLAKEQDKLANVFGLRSQPPRFPNQGIFDQPVEAGEQYILQPVRRLRIDDPQEEIQAIQITKRFGC